MHMLSSVSFIFIDPGQIKNTIYNIEQTLITNNEFNWNIIANNYK